MIFERNILGDESGRSVWECKGQHLGQGSTRLLVRAGRPLPCGRGRRAVGGRQVGLCVLEGDSQGLQR